ncbi:MAG: hypothetical protein QXD48_02605 [Candidatus Aenigmatarchaeota archaeon]
MDKIKEIEERLNRLEEKTKASFLEVERRFAQMPEQINIPETINERITELEDLLLLLQVENIKIKEKLGYKGFGLTDISDITQRLEKLESHVYSSEEGKISESGEDLRKEIENLSKRINEIDERIRLINVGISPDLEERIGNIENKTSIITEKIKEFIIPKNIEERLQSIERSMDDIKTKSKSSVIPKDIEQRLKSLETIFNKEINNIENRVSKLESLVAETRRIEEHYIPEEKIIMMPESGLLLDVQRILKGGE